MHDEGQNKDRIFSPKRAECGNLPPENNGVGGKSPQWPAGAQAGSAPVLWLAKVVHVTPKYEGCLAYGLSEGRGALNP